MYVSLMPSRKTEILCFDDRRPIGMREEETMTAEKVITVAIYDDAQPDPSHFLSLNFDGIAHLRSFITSLEGVASRLAADVPHAEPTDDDDDDDESYTPSDRWQGKEPEAFQEGTAGNPIVHPSCERCGNHPCTCTQPAVKDEYAEHGTAD